MHFSDYNERETIPPAPRSVIVAFRDDPLMPPRHVVEHFRRAYLGVNGREPQVRYMGNHWYFVNGETVHRITLIQEIARLQEFSQKQHYHPPVEKSLIQRLISRLRSL